MIATLKSIDHLLNRFDALSQCHSNFLVEFDTKFVEYENPLRHVTRNKDEQRKTTTNLLETINEHDSPLSPLEDFHRRILRSRYLHRPPNYSPNSLPAIPNIPSKSSFTTAETLTKVQAQPRQTNVRNHPIESKTIQITKKELKYPTRSTITTFSMETAIRLSQPKRYNRMPEPKLPTKPPKKDLAKGPPKLPTVKRPKPNVEKSPPKKIKPIVRPKRSPPSSRPATNPKVYNVSFPSNKKVFRL